MYGGRPPPEKGPSPNPPFNLHPPQSNLILSPPLPSPPHPLPTTHSPPYHPPTTPLKPPSPTLQSPHSTAPSTSPPNHPQPHLLFFLLSSKLKLTPKNLPQHHHQPAAKKVKTTEKKEKERVNRVSASLDVEAPIVDVIGFGRGGRSIVCRWLLGGGLLGRRLWV